MNVTSLSIPDVLLIEPKIFGDDRGFFYESFNERAFEAATGINVRFVQDNHSRSVKNVLRGLHCQLEPKSQGKMVRVVLGEVFDVVVDIRKNSPTFGRWAGERLSADNKRQLWIPAGFAHGFLVLSDTAEFLYKATEYYAPEFERGIRWDDPDIGINWPLSGAPCLSRKDSEARTLREFLEDESRP